MWPRGNNFLQAKYRIINQNSFVPHIRSNFTASVPRGIIENFIPATRNLVTLVEFKHRNSAKKNLRIKKLHKQANSFIISLKAEKNMEFDSIKVIKILSETEVLNRSETWLKNKTCLSNIIPKTTSGNTPIYVFENGENLAVGGYYKKDIVCRKEIELDEAAISAIGLYYCEGGRVAASFTNSWPAAINTVLNFVEKNFGMERTGVKASVFCNPSLKGRKKQLEEFWASQTGIENFADGLHLGKNSRSLQGTLELYFCSQVLKEIFCSIIGNINRHDFDKIPMIRGVLSGDGSPLQHTKSTINHHVAFDGSEYNMAFLNSVFGGFKTRKLSTANRFVIKTDWNANKHLLLNDAYKFNDMNRIRFSRRFLKLPRTTAIHDQKIEHFKNKNYPQMIKEFDDHLKTLINLELIGDDRAEAITNGFALY